MNKWGIVAALHDREKWGIVSVHIQHGWYIIIRRLKAKNCRARARRNQIPGKVKCEAYEKQGIWYVKTKVKAK